MIKFIQYICCFCVHLFLYSFSDTFCTELFVGASCESSSLHSMNVTGM